MGRFFIFLGILFILIGVFMIVSPKIHALRQLGHLPGDLLIKKEGFTFYFPMITCIIISVALTLVFQLIRFLKNR